MKDDANQIQTLKKVLRYIKKYGWNVQIPVYPFSFSEYMRALSADGSQVEPRKAFQDYLNLGGSPFRYDLNFQPVPSAKYLSDIFGTILLKDVVQRNAIRDANQLERIIDYALEQVGHLLSAKKISDYLKSDHRSISVDTVYSYLKSLAHSVALDPRRSIFR